MGHNSPEYIRVVAEAMKIATADKDSKVGDPKFFDVPMDELTSKDYAKRRADAIKRGDKADVTAAEHWWSGKQTYDTGHDRR